MIECLVSVCSVGGGDSSGHWEVHQGDNHLQTLGYITAYAGSWAAGGAATPTGPFFQST